MQPQVLYICNLELHSKTKPMESGIFSPFLGPMGPHVEDNGSDKTAPTTRSNQSRLTNTPYCNLWAQKWWKWFCWSLFQILLPTLLSTLLVWIPFDANLQIRSQNTNFHSPSTSIRTSVRIFRHVVDHFVLFHKPAFSSLALWSILWLSANTSSLLGSVAQYCPYVYQRLLRRPNISRIHPSWLDIPEYPSVNCQNITSASVRNIIYQKLRVAELSR